jgi:hypothetical protein
VTAQKHSTVWDGAETLFDINFLALGVDPDEAWRLASKDGRVLKVGRTRAALPRNGRTVVRLWPAREAAHAPSRTAKLPAGGKVIASGPSRGKIRP